MEAQLDRQGSECFNDIKETVTSLVVKHQTPADRRHVSLLSTVRKIIQVSKGVGIPKHDLLAISKVETYSFCVIVQAPQFLRGSG